MGLTTRTLPQLFNGVSRQPAILRSIDQTESELNSWAAASAGVGKRPPTEHIVKLADSVGPDAFLHTINRDVSERYVVVIDGGTIRVVGFDGVERTVNAPGGTAYLAGGDLTAVTVADYTFIVNRAKTIGMKPLVAGSPPPDTLPSPTYVRDPRRPVYYKDVYDPDSVYLAGGEGSYTPNPNYGATAVTARVSSVEKLPATAPNGTVYEVQGSAANPSSSFFVVRNGEVWDETVKPGLVNAIDEASMPHCLIREGDGTFTFAPFSWAPRRVGDDTTNPAPTFVGRTIRDVFFYQNRLAFLVDENVILSCAGDFGNFWRNTVIDVIDSDVVDVAVTTSQVSLLEHAILFNDGALLIADQTQFSMSNGEDGVTPASMSIQPVTHYTVNKAAKPATMGTEVYFCGEASGRSVVYEYSRLQDTDATTAADITAHVPGLIPGGVTKLCAGTRSLFAFFGNTEAFCYQLYWNGDEKLMSAWRPWAFHGNVLSAIVLDDQLYLMVEHSGDGVYLERMNLSDGARPTTQPKQVYLDRRVELVGTYDEATDRTTYVLPYPVLEPDRGLVDAVWGEGSPAPHRKVQTQDIEWIDAITFTVRGELTGTTSVGLRYEFHIELSQQFPVDYQGRPLTSGRLQMRGFHVRYTDSGHFKVEVLPYGRAPRADLEGSFPKRTAVFSGKVLGTTSTLLGAPSYSTGSFSAALAGDSRKVVIRLTNDSYMASTFSSAEWDGLYNSRAMG